VAAHVGAAAGVRAPRALRHPGGGFVSVPPAGAIRCRRIHRRAVVPAHPPVVAKADFQLRDRRYGLDELGINFGIGWLF
jgi:hypothetical protein